MLPPTAFGQARLPFWQRVREFAVPPPMIESATARRSAGDWAGACAAARVDVELDLRAVARAHGSELAATVRADLRRLAPDLLRWHMPRIAPDGLLRPGLTISLATYDHLHLVARTPPSWADAGQRIGLALWEGSRSSRGHPHPHPHPDKRFRLDLHRHLWDADRAGELRERAGPWDPLVPKGIGCAVDRWGSEAAIVLRSQGRDSGTVLVRLGSGRRLLLHVGEELRITEAPARGGDSGWPELPDAATWVLPDLALLHSGQITADRLHPLVAAALVLDYAPGREPPDPDGQSVRLVECRGAVHRIGLVDGVLVPLDHDQAQLRREQLLVGLGGPPLPCLRVIDETHREPERLVEIRARLDHGDFAGALAAVEKILGPDALLRQGALRDELDTAVQRRIAHGLYRAGLAVAGPLRVIDDDERRDHKRRRVLARRRR